eukprot:46029-Pyramimonas_sp.AAC.1
MRSSMLEVHQPGTYPYPYAGHLLITMPILGILLLFEGASLRCSSPFGVSILGIRIRSRLERGCGKGGRGLEEE